MTTRNSSARAHTRAHTRAHARAHARATGARLARKATAALAAASLACALVPAAAIQAIADDTSEATTAITIGDTQADGGYASQAQENSQLLATTSYTWANELYSSDGTGTGEETYTSIIWEDGSWTANTIKDGTGTAVWSTYVKGDDSHYGHYSVDITFTVTDGVLTGVDMSSSGTTFGGVWGNISKSTTIQGALPEGVSNTTTVTFANSDGMLEADTSGTPEAGESYYTVSSGTAGEGAEYDEHVGYDESETYYELTNADEDGTDETYAEVTPTENGTYYTIAATTDTVDDTNYAEYLTATTETSTDSDGNETTTTTYAQATSYDADATYYSASEVNVLVSFESGVTYYISAGAVVTPTLAYASESDTDATIETVYGGYEIDSATLYQVNAQGGIYELDSDGNVVTETVTEDDGDVVEEAVTLGSADAEVADDGTITVEDTSCESGYGVLATTFVIGSYFKFTQYTALNDYGQKYSFEPTNFFEAISGIGQKNRDEYTAYAFNLVTERELASFVDNLNSGGTDETAATVDIVSGATKSSDAVVEAVYAALGYYYPITNKDGLTYSVTSGRSSTTVGQAATPTPVLASSDEGKAASGTDGWDAIFTSVADDLELTMDANVSEDYEGTEGTIDANDTTTVTKDSDGNYVVTSGLFTNSDYFTTGSVALYDYGESELTDLESVNLGFQTGYVVNGAESGYEGCDEYVGGAISSTSINHGFLGALGCTYDDDYEITEYGTVDVTDSDGNTIATYDAATDSLTVLDSSVTHVAFGFNIAKASTNDASGIAGAAYDLEELYYTDISSATVTLESASATYTGSAITPAVSSVVLDGVTLDSSAYSVSYADNVNAGTATVTVTGLEPYKGQATATFSIGKASQSLKVTAGAVSAKGKYKKGKLARNVVVKKAAIQKKIAVKGAQGKVTYAGIKNVTFKKGKKKGSKVTLTVTVKAAGSANYNAATKKVKVTVRLK